MLEEIVAWESQLLLLIQDSLRGELLSGILIPVTHLGDLGIFWIAVGVVLLCIPRTRRAGVAALLSLAVCLVVNNFTIKLLVNRTRPFVQIAGLVPLIKPPYDSSFPSGHTNAAFACAVACWHTLEQRWLRWVLLGMAVLMGFSRLYVGVHFPTDVIGGVLVGSIGSSVVCAVLKRSKWWNRIPEQ